MLLATPGSGPHALTAMFHFVARRFIVLLVTLLAVSALSFSLPYVSEGDPARSILRARVSDLALDPDTVAALEVKYGLDRPLLAQYADWLGNAVRGDFGYSFTNRLPVGEQIGDALWVSATLALTALAIAVVVAFPLGTVVALRPGRFLDNVVTFFTQSLVALPEYWLGPLGILIFALYLGWLPSAGWQDPSHVAMPAVVLALRPLAYFTRVTRASMLDVLNAPYITAARSRGLGIARTVIAHGLRNGTPPVMTLFAIWLAGLIGGAVVVEVIFAVPGIGRLVYGAVVNHDLPMLQAGIVCIVALAVAINTVADLLYLALNPALRVPRDVP